VFSVLDVRSGDWLSVLYRLVSSVDGEISLYPDEKWRHRYNSEHGTSRNIPGPQNNANVCNIFLLGRF